MHQAVPPPRPSTRSPKAPGRLPPGWRPKAFRFFLGLLVGLAGGYAFLRLSLPLPWTLGSMAAATLFCLAAQEIFVPKVAAITVRPVIGVLAGSAFTPEIFSFVARWIPEIASVVALSAANTGIGYVLFRHIFRHDSATAFFSSAPGGMVELTLVGVSYGGNVRVLAMTHALRIMAVVFAIPFFLRGIGVSFGSGVATMQAGNIDAAALDYVILAGCAVAGYILGRSVPIPGGVMMATAGLSVFVHASGLTHAVIPQWLIVIVQIVIGITAGARFFGVTAREMRTVVLQGLTWAFLICSLSLLAAGILSAVFHRSFVSFVLATAPGGIAEMTLVTYAIGIDIAFVITCHLLRILVALLGAPLVFRLTGKKPTGPSG